MSCTAMHILLSHELIQFLADFLDANQRICASRRVVDIVPCCVAVCAREKCERVLALYDRFAALIDVVNCFWRQRSSAKRTISLVLRV